MDALTTPLEWYPHILHHPGLKPVEKLLFHLMQPLGGDTPFAARKAAQQLGIGERYGRQLRAHLRALGCFQPAPPCRNPGAEKEPSGTGVPEPPCQKTPERNPGAASHESLNACYSTAFEEHSTTTVLVPPYPPLGRGEKPTKPYMDKQTPSPDSAQVPAQAAALVQEWDQTFPTTAQGARSGPDQKAMVALLTQHGKTPADIRAYIVHIRDQHKLTYWPRPARLTQPTQRGQGPLVFALIETQIDALKEPPHGIHRPTRHQHHQARFQTNLQALQKMAQRLDDQEAPAFDSSGFIARLGVAHGA